MQAKFTDYKALSFDGIDKSTYRHGLALQDRGLNAQYIDASAHCEVIFKSKHARKFHIPVTELVNLSIPSQPLKHARRLANLSGKR